MKIEVGMYVRIDTGSILKIDEKLLKELNTPITNVINACYLKYEDIKSYSFNLIDLIEVGDYVNGKEVTSIQKEKDIWVGFANHDFYIIDTNEIKSIVTHEMFEQISYKVGE